MTGEWTDQCVVNPIPAESKVNPGAIAQSGRLTLKQITNVRELYTLWEMSAAATVGAGSWGADARAKYAREHSENTFSNLLVISVVVANPTEVLETYHLTADAQKLLTTGPPEAFLKACGDSFGATRVVGGRFDAVFQLTTETIRDSEDKAISIDVSGVSGSGSFSLSDKIRKMIETRARDVQFFRDGTSDPFPSAKSPDDIEAYAMQFPTKVAQTPYVYEFGVVDYSKIVDLTSAERVKVPDTTQQRRILSALASGLSDWRDFLGQIGYVRNNSYQFDVYSDADMTSREAQARATIQTLEASIQQCTDNPLAGCSLPANFAAPSGLNVKRIISDRVYRGSVERCNKGLLGTQSPLLGCNAEAIGFLLVNPDGPQVWRGKSTDCIVGALYRTPADCQEPIGFLASTPEKGGKVLVWEGLIANNNQGLLSTDSCFIAPGLGNAFYAEGGRYKGCRDGLRAPGIGPAFPVARRVGYLYGRFGQ